MGKAAWRWKEKDVIRSRFDQIKAYTTKDGSLIRELMHPAVHGNTGASLALAEVAPGARTQAHRHVQSEELYFFMEGSGIMGLGGETFAVQAGDTVCIPPGTSHWVQAAESAVLKLLCICFPAYAHEDTVLEQEA